MMAEREYTVKKGDTLTRIAAQKGTTPQVLAQLNQLANMDKISIGQVLKLPPQAQPSPASPAPGAAAGAAPEPEASWSQLMMQFVDVFSKPIADLKVWIHSGSEVHEAKTDHNGRVPQVVVPKKGGKIEVKVAKPDGSKKKVAEFEPPNDVAHVRLVSPKAKVTSETRPHEGKPPAQQPAAPATGGAPAPGAVTNTRSPAGNPVQQVALECPNSDNLRLGPNLKYRAVVIAAAKRAKVVPQAVCALMNAEAATIVITHTVEVLDKNKKPVIDKKTGKPKVKKWTENTGEWNAKSASGYSSARGMTQFLDGSWIAQAVIDGTFLNERAKSEGWLTTTTVTPKKGKPRTELAFKQADGTLVTGKPGRDLGRVLSSRPYLTGRATASDANLQKLLDLRYEPEFAIHTAVDYGMQNLEGLENAKFKVSGLSDIERAKIFYLCHHLGLLDAKKFINNTMSAAHARYLLEQQVGNAAAAKRAKDENDDYLTAHRNWLDGFVNSRISFVNFECKPSSGEAPMTLLKVTEKIRP